MVGDMEIISEEQLSTILMGMKESAPEGFSQLVMQRVRRNRPKRSPLTWFIPISGAVAVAIVLLVSINMFSGPHVKMADNTINPSALMAEEEITDKLSDDAFYGSERPSAAMSRAPARTSEVPIGGYSTVGLDGSDSQSFSSRLSSNRNMTANLVSGIIDQNQLDTITKSLREFGDPLVRTDSFGNFLIDMGIHFDRIEEFDNTVHPLLSKIGEDDQGSLLIRVTAVR